MVAYDPANDPWTNQFSQPAATTGPGGDLFSAWSSAAPSLPTQLLHQFATAGISPADPVGSWAIKTGVPALGSTKPLSPGITEGGAASRVLGSPQLLAEFKKLPLDKQTQIFQMSAPQVGALSDQQLTRLAQTGSSSVHHSIFNKIGDAFTTGARAAFTGLAAGAEAVGGAFRDRVAAGANDPTAAGLAAEAHGVPAGRALDYTFQPRSGTTLDTGIGGKITFGKERGVDNVLDQITLTHALEGQSTGGGFFPAGPAREAAVQAQREAANINGHALTPGRAIAGAVVQPGSRPYSIISGLTDATIAMKGDPAAIALGELSDAVKAARTFAPTGDAARLSVAHYLVNGAASGSSVKALRDWSGIGTKDNLVAGIRDKLAADPGSLQNLIDHPDLGLTAHDIAAAVGRDHTGAVQALRNLVDQPTALNWLNSKAGVDYADWAASHSFRDIWLASNKKLPVDVVAQLHDATSADQVRTILGREIGTVVRGVPEGVMPYGWNHPFSSLRLANNFYDKTDRLFEAMPRGVVDIENPDNAVDQVHRMFSSAKVNPGLTDDLLADVAKAQNRPQFYNAYNRAVDAVKDTLVERGVDPNLAHTLTRYSTDQAIEDQARWVDQVGDVPHISGFASAGDTVPIAGPHMSSELLNRALPVLDMRTINRNVGAWGHIYSNEGIVGDLAKTAVHLSDFITSTFKAFTLLKLALPVRFLIDEQARMAADGMQSMFRHPWSYAESTGLLDEGRHNPMALIAHVIGSPGGSEADMLGEKWVDQLADRNSAISRAVGQSAHWSSAIFDADLQLSKHYVTYNLESPNGLRSWADELSHLHITPESREVARALQDVEYVPSGITGKAGLDAVKQSFWDGPLSKYRNELADAHLFGGTSAEMRTSREAADGYIDSVVQRVRTATSDHPELVDAVANGGAFGPNGITKEFKGALGDLRSEGVGPETVRGRAAVAVRQDPRVLKNMVDRMLGALMDAPTKTLTRSPAFKEMYLRRFDELAPYVKDGTIDAVKADLIAKSHALQHVRDLLYYPGERTNITEKLRNIVPFGEAWRNVMKSWIHLSAENPQVFRRVQQGVTSLRDGGFIYPDPQSGKEVFNLVPAGMMKHLSGVPFPMTAPVAGINIVGAGLPGVGPAVQIPADALLPHNNIISDTLRNHLLPYGSPDYSGGFFEDLFPGWYQKFQTAGFLAHYLPGNPSIPFMAQTDNQKRVLTDLAQSVFGYHVSAGNYDLTNPDVLNNLTKQSMWEAQKLYMLRGLGQFASPAAPTITNETQLKDGSLIETWKLTQDFRTMEKAYPNLDDAVMHFVDKYGPKTIFATEAHAQRAPFAIPTTEEAGIWKSQHEGFAGKFPNTFAYWAPTQGQFSYETYLSEVKRGALVPRSVDQWAKLADARLGNAIYSNLRAKLPPSPSQAQRDWLAEQKQKITEQYPGFNDDSLKLSRQTTDQTVTELRDAVNDPSVKDTPIAQAARTYIALRDEAIAVARQRTGAQTTGLSGKTMTDLRTWLYENGTKIALQHPDFQTMWNYVFLNEVEPAENK